MKPPSSTYRVQLRNGMTFGRAAELVPYLKRLGISHLYASPIFTATQGSTHGYDVTNANELDPALGGRDGFLRMSDVLREHGLGLILDIVPNHMAASLENPWWRGVLESGPESQYARHFDIDWSRRLTLPFLGDTFEKVLEAGDLSIRLDPHSGKPVLAYHDTLYPLVPSSYEGRQQEVLATSTPSRIAELHDRQPWRLISWRDAPRELSYRRFFEVTGLVGLRVEDPAVFEDAHRTLLELVRDGRVDGLRLDHIDGLADPKAYLERLRQAVGPEVYIVVEKILGEGEHLPEDWPVCGTTGYEFIGILGNALVDGGGIDNLGHAYEAMAGQTIDPSEELRNAKLLMADSNFEGEVLTLRRLAMEIQAKRGRPGAIPEDAMHGALRELLVAFPVYRTYGTDGGMPPESQDRLRQIVERVRNRADAPDDAVLSFLHEVLAGSVGGMAAETAGHFRIRFQQLTGPLMAKSLEDTLFYRHHRLLAMNEVGAEADPRPPSTERFHRDMQIRLERQPHALSCTSTHDTKRGEDARARLYAISEAPQLWAEAVDRWRSMNASRVVPLSDGPAPEPAVEWMLYQALAGAWPTDLAPDDTEALSAIRERFLAYVEKALREAKQRTNWGDVNADYEHAVRTYATWLLSPENADFLGDFRSALEPFVCSGLVNGITQTLVKLVAPGIPDIYQGSERLDLSLVDPDNRRPPDFEALTAGLSDTQALPGSEESWRSGRLKQHIIAGVLDFRRRHAELFDKGSYIPLKPEGRRARHLVSFARRTSGMAAVLVAPRFVFGAFHQGVMPSSERWAESAIALPEELRGLRYRDLFTGRTFEPARYLSVSWAFADHPFALLVSERADNGAEIKTG